MPLSQADRIAFSLSVATAPAQAAGIDLNKAAIQKQATSLAALDTANTNLFTLPNSLVNSYQAEFAYLDGNIRTSIVEQDIQDSANKVLGNHFFPNNQSVSVPSLSSKNNIWSQIVPYALSYAIGKNYSEAYGTQANPEPSLISTLLAYVTTSPTPSITASVNLYISVLQAEVAVITTADTNSTNKTNNLAAVNNINNVILPALNAWLSASHPAPTISGSPPVTTYSSDPAVTTLQTAVTARQTFIATRVTQLQTVLGSIVQDISTGNITSSSGLYGQRYGSLVLRIHALSGSLSQIANLNAGINAQTSLKASLLQNSATYSSYVPTSLLKSNANNLSTIHVANSALFSPGDTVYIYAEGQSELLRAVKSINNDVVVLNDIVPSKYTVGSNARIYKDIS